MKVGQVLRDWRTLLGVESVFKDTSVTPELEDTKLYVVDISTGEKFEVLSTDMDEDDGSISINICKEG